MRPEIRLNYTHYDWMIVGGDVLGGAPLTLDRVAATGRRVFSLGARWSWSGVI